MSRCTEFTTAQSSGPKLRTSASRTPVIIDSTYLRENPVLGTYLGNPTPPKKQNQTSRKSPTLTSIK